MSYKSIKICSLVILVASFFCLKSYGQQDPDRLIKEHISQIKSVMVNYPDSGRSLVNQLRIENPKVSPSVEVLIQGLEIYSLFQTKSLDSAEVKIGESLALMAQIDQTYKTRGDTLSISYIDLQQSRANQLNNLGVIYYYRGDVPTSISYFVEASKIRIPLLAHPDEMVRLRAENEYAGTIDNIANLYKLTGQIDKALEYRLLADKVVSKRKDKLAVGIRLNISTLYSETGRPDSALYYARIAYQWTDTLDLIGHHYLAASLLGSVYQEMGDLTNAKKYLTIANDGLKKLGSADWEDKHYYRLALYYLKAGQYQKSIDAIEHAFSIMGQGGDPDFYETLKDAYWNLAEENHAISDYQNAMLWTNKYHAWKDSIWQSERVDEFNRLQTEFETEQKEAQNIQLQAVNKQQAIANRYLVLAAMALGLFLLALLIFYRRLQRSKRIIEQQSQELAKLNDLKSEFFASISHELRTPLTLAKGNIELLSDQIKNADQLKKVSNSRRSLNQLSRMVEDLLDLSKFELGRFQVNPQNTDLDVYLRRVVAAFSSLAEEKKVNLQYENKSNAKAFAKLDARHFEKVINNLLYNAFKFTNPDDAVTIGLAVENDRAIIRVSDTGKGISAEDLPYIFNRFYQAGNHDGTVGSGLGLSIVKELVDLHGGTIEVQSEEHKGTEFTIVLDAMTVYDQQEEEQDLQVGDLVADRLSKIQSKKRTILLVEDNVDMQEYLLELLGETFTVSIAGNGEEALRMLQSKTPSLIISDVMMPVMDGFELLNHVKGNPVTVKIPFILLTAKATGEDRLQGLRLGVDDYITKPFDREELLIRVLNLIENLEYRLKWAADNPKDAEVESETDQIDVEDAEIIERLKQYVIDNLTNSKISIPELASAVAMSDRQLYRRTSEICGMTPNQLVMEVRLQQARSLLLKGGIVKLSQLAMEVGIGTPAYLSRQYYERFGKRPTDYIS